MKELRIKKCGHCGAMVEVLKDCKCKDCGMICCGEKMKELVPNSVEASVEKHVPTYQRLENELLVTVNHVMDEDHYIEWIALASDHVVEKRMLKYGQEAKVVFPYMQGSTLYAYCNKHGLWKKDVD